ncbi:addiction module antitoxin [Sphingomonadales bacterium EhC05]|nr:addiction module antitoxin [Sphingomonadales bacterium EhC05]
MTIRKTIVISEPQDDWIKAQIASGMYNNDSEYLRDLIRKDQQRNEKIAAMQKLIDEGLASGTSNRTIEDIFEEAIENASGA